MPLDQTTETIRQIEAIRLLSAMETLLRRRGRWIKHEAHVERRFPLSLFMPKHGYCILGALNAVGLPSQAYTLVAYELTQAARELNYQNAADFNDAPETTLKQILRLLDHVKQLMKDRAGV